MKTYTRLLLLVCALALVLSACGRKPQETAPSETGQETLPTQTAPETPAEAELAFDTLGILLDVGQRQQLALNQAGAGFQSGDEGVATVTSDGTVTAVGKGHTFITATTSDGKTAQCGVIVGLRESELIDIREVKPELRYSQQRMIHANVMRDIVTVDGEFYFLQRNDSEPSDLTLMHFNDQGYTDEWMTFIGFGSGASISAEPAENGEWYVWIESNGDAASRGQTVSRIKYEPGKSYTAQGGQTWYFNQTTGAVYASVDVENGLVCVRNFATGGYRFTWYDLAAMRAGGPAVPLYRVSLSMQTAALDKSLNPDGMDVTEFTFHGFAVSGQYIYQYYGTAGLGVIVAVYDMEGNGVYVHEVKDYPDMNYREADGINIYNGELYIGISSGGTGERRANVLYYPTGRENPA